VGRIFSLLRKPSKGFCPASGRKSRSPPAPLTLTPGEVGRQPLIPSRPSAYPRRPRHNRGPVTRPFSSGSMDSPPLIRVPSPRKSASGRGPGRSRWAASVALASKRYSPLAAALPVTTPVFVLSVIACLLGFCVGGEAVLTLAQHPQRTPRSEAACSGGRLPQGCVLAAVATMNLWRADYLVSQDPGQLIHRLLKLAGTPVRDTCAESH